MKLPFDFGPKLVFRLGLPGLVIGIATAPLTFALAHAAKAEVDRLEVIAVSTVFWGWIICLSDMPIYMFYEGRRFWPNVISKWGINRETCRLASLQKYVTEEISAQNRVLFMESAIDLLDFP